MEGIIKITDKVQFVYYELPKPQKGDYDIQQVGVVAGEIVETEVFRDRDYLKAMKEYQASKREVEVSNAAPPFLETALNFNPSLFNVWNGLACEAEVTTIMTPNMLEISKATITKITNDN